MPDIFVESLNIISPLGNTAKDNFFQAGNSCSAVQLQNRPDINESPFWASLISEKDMQTISAEIQEASKFTRFEKLLIGSIQDALKTSSVDISGNKTLLIISTTKGNISLLEQEDPSPALYERINLHHSASSVAGYFHCVNKPVVISNACISGSFAVLFAKRMLEAGRYDHAVIAGADTISKFVFSGFQALSAGRCKPFSPDRDGINLGEAASAIILTAHPANRSDGNNIRVSGGAVSNDSNHISGPSRTGQELSVAIDKAMAMAKITPSDIDFISAHGTATLFNDEMEIKAFCLSHLQDAPVNGLKCFFGHTLGAAGLVESVISILSLKNGVIIPVLDFSDKDAPAPINVCKALIYKETKHFLKTASGFGGCNAALVFSKS